MRRVVVGLATLAILSAQVSAQEWGTDFNMGTFAGGGGTDASGYLSFECPDKSSGLETAGQPFIELKPMVGVVLNKKSVPKEGVTFWIEDEQSYLVPMSLEPGGQSLSYDYSTDSVQSVRDLVAALRTGSRVAAYAGKTQLIMMTLDGSGKALEFVERCVAG